MSDQQIPEASITAATVAVHDVDCPDRKCRGPALGYSRKLALAALEAAAPVIAAQATAAVCDWLVTEVGFPFDFTFGDKPAWLDLHQVAEAWHRHDPREDVETWLLTIIDETGWEATDAE